MLPMEATRLKPRRSNPDIIRSRAKKDLRAGSSCRTAQCTAAVNAAENFQIQLCVISGNQADHKRNYIVDQIGYYSDPLSYIKSATEGYGAAGDFDNNGSVNTTDLVYLRKLLLGIGEKTDKVYQSCDIDKDGEISVIDMIRLKKAMA